MFVHIYIYICIYIYTLYIHVVTVNRFLSAVWKWFLPDYAAVSWKSELQSNGCVVKIVYMHILIEIYKDIVSTSALLSRICIYIYVYIFAYTPINLKLIIYTYIYYKYTNVYKCVYMYIHLYIHL